MDDPRPYDPDRADDHGNAGALPEEKTSAARPVPDAAGGVGRGGGSAGGAYAGGPEGKPDDHAGQHEQGYSGPPNDNATSTRGATRDRAS